MTPGPVSANTPQITARLIVYSAPGGLFVIRYAAPLWPIRAAMIIVTVGSSRAGVRVLEPAPPGAGPWGGGLLAVFGADVGKVGHPAGGVARRSPPFLPGTDPPLSFMHETVNRNKRSVALDLHGDAGRALF